MSELLTRRRLLLAGGAGALVGCATAGTAAWLGAPDRGARVLTAHEHAIVAAVAEVMFPSGFFPVDGVEAGVAGLVDGILADVLDPLRGAGFRYVLRALEWGTMASRGVRFTALCAADRHEVLVAWSEPTVLARRVAGDALKVVLGMAYFQHPVVLEAMGWRASCAAARGSIG